MKVERILIAVDFSDTAAAAARYAVEHFAPDAEAILLHAIELPERQKFAADKLPPDETMERAAREHASAKLQEMIHALGRAGERRARMEIRVGKPHAVAIAAARELRADVLVIGPHADESRSSRFLGTTADRIARTSPIPVLVATEPELHRPRKLLAPVDDDAVVETVLDWTRFLAEQFDADVNLLHVWSNAIYSHVASMAYATTRSEHDARAAIESELRDATAHWLDHLAQAGFTRHRAACTVAWGKTGDVVVETAAAQQADVIIIGRRRTGALTSALLGNTALAVLHGARCPVLIVMAPDA
jgi:nucleotide-binding universal stress UspA family protein